EEAYQHQRACKQVSNVEGQAAHHRLRETNRRSVARRPSISAAPRNSGTRNTRIFAIDVSNSASSVPATVSLARKATSPIAKSPSPAPDGTKPQGANRQAISEI